MTKPNAAGILETMLYKHKCNAAFIDFDSDNEEEIELASEWTKKKEALEMAIEMLRK